MSFLKKVFRSYRDTRLATWQVSDASCLTIEQHKGESSTGSLYSWYLVDRHSGARVPFELKDVRDLITTLYLVAKRFAGKQGYSYSTEVATLEEAMMYSLEESMEQARRERHRRMIEEAEKRAGEGKQEILQKFVKEIRSLIQEAGGSLTPESGKEADEVAVGMLEDTATQEAFRLLLAKREQDLRQWIKKLITEAGGHVTLDNEKRIQKITVAIAFFNSLEGLDEFYAGPVDG
jgi:hypothetical protein